MRDPKAYAKKVESYVERFATPQDADEAGDDSDDDDEDQPMGGSLGRPKTVERGTNGGNGHTNGNGKTSAAEEEEEEEEGEEEDDDGEKMSDMGALSDRDDEFMGEMDE